MQLCGHVYQNFWLDKVCCVTFENSVLASFSLSRWPGSLLSRFHTRGGWVADWSRSSARGLRSTAVKGGNGCHCHPYHSHAPFGRLSSGFKRRRGVLWVQSLMHNKHFYDLSILWKWSWNLHTCLAHWLHFQNAFQCLVLMRKDNTTRVSSPTPPTQKFLVHKDTAVPRCHCRLYTSL